jgi:hypothetical protein
MNYTIRGFWGSNWNVDEDGLRNEVIRHVRKRLDDMGLGEVHIDYQTIDRVGLLDDDTVEMRMSSTENVDMIVMDISEVDTSIYFTLGLLIGRMKTTGITKPRIYLLSNDEGFDPSSHEIRTVFIILKDWVKVIPYSVVDEKVVINNNEWWEM